MAKTGKGGRKAPRIDEGKGAPARRGGKSQGSSRARTASAARASSKAHGVRVEAVFFYLFDAGRSIDLKKAASILGGAEDVSVIGPGRDTPDYMSLPRPLHVGIAEGETAEGPYRAYAKVFEDGAVSIVLRRTLNERGERFHEIRKRPFGNGLANCERFARAAFEGVRERIGPALDRKGYPDVDADKSYAAYCIVDDVGDPGGFVAANARAIGALLIDESGDPSIHDSQIATTLGNPFSYRRGELAVFDFDRCLIIDPARDYEDLLLVAEHANYQLLELRQLDSILDGRLDVAEDDMRAVFGKRRGLPSLKRLSRKFAEIEAIRVDALFILENLENSSKIIGDYHLGRVYSHLCAILNTAGWRWSVERRLETLHGIYELARGDVNDRTMMFLEIAFILVCVFQVIQFFFV